jgi:glycosyltransferase involved in cell wall biosynthesis
MSKISLIFPAYNEEDNIFQAVEEFKNTGLCDEIIVVNNNSKDRTAERAAAAGARVILETMQGYGAALQRGMKEAKNDYIVLAEPDGTFVAKDLKKLLAYAEDFEMVLGTRTSVELIWAGANMGRFLRYGNVVVAKLLEFLYGGPCLTDCGCTFRLIRRSAYEKIAAKLTVRRSHFLPEMVILALREKIRFIEIPVNYRSRIGESKITGSLKGAVSTGVRMLILIFTYKFR